MHLARTLAILTAMTMAAMALTATSASAVEVSLEPSSNHCSTVTLMSNHSVEGGCRVRAISEKETLIQVQLTPGVWFAISACEDQFEAAIGENGEGYLYNAITTGHESGTQCTLSQCDEGVNENNPHAKKPWHLRLNSTTSMEVRFCLRTKTLAEGTTGPICHTNIDVNDTISFPHNYEFRATGATTSSGVCENNTNLRVIGHWNQVVDQAHPAIEIRP